MLLDTLKKWMPNRTNWFGWCSIVLTVVIAVAWQANTPLHSDDFIYQRIFDDKGHYDGDLSPTSSQYITEIPQVIHSIINHYEFTNGRAANLSFIAIQLFSVWFIKLICGLILGGLIILLWCWPGKYVERNNLIALITPILIWRGLQWETFMQSSDFMFNYVGGSLLMMVCLYLFYEKEKSKGEWRWLILILFSIWHEGFTVVLGFFFLAQLFLRKDRISFIVLCFLFLGALFQYSPGTQNRLFNSSSIISNLRYYPWTLLIIQSWTSFIALVWWILRRKNIKDDDRKKIDNFGIGFIAAWIGAFCIILFVSAPQRVHWPNDILAICLILRIAATYKNIKPAIWIKVFLISIYVLWGASLIYCQRQITQFTETCVTSLKKGETIIVDERDVLNEKIPFWLGDMVNPQYNSFEIYSYLLMPYVLTENKYRGYIVLPSNQDYQQLTDLEKIPGNNDMYFAGNKVFVRKHDGKDIEKHVKVTFDKMPFLSSPTGYLMSNLKYGSKDTVIQDLAIIYQARFVAENDTLETIIFENLPKTLKHRKVLSVDLQ